MAESASAPMSDKQQQQQKKRQQVLQLLRDLQVDSGDIVVFDRACGSMSAYGAAICVCAKFFGNTQWDHNGVVVRDPNYDPADSSGSDADGSGGLYLMEATLTGVKMRPLVERIMRSKSHEVALRKLEVHRSDDFAARAWDFAQTVLNSPYEDRPQMMFNAGVKVPTRVERERLFDLVVTKKKELAALDSELRHRLRMPEFERNALLQERELVYEHYHALVAQLSQTERSVFENARIAQPHAKTKMFCSQLTAGLYQHLGLLLPYPSANSYLPKHFSSADGDGEYLKLQQDATLLPEISLRRKLQANFDDWRARAHDAVSRAPQSAHEVNTIVRCLRRHQFFHSLSEAELVAISKQFRRRALLDGEVVFYQGTPGDFFYIIEHGECDVLVDYDHLRRTQEGDEQQANPISNPSGNGDAELPVRLQRRKTLSLPDFQDASSAPSERVLVATNGPGSAFGESALIYDTPRRATLRASTRRSEASLSASTAAAVALAPRVVLWQLDKTAFKEIVEAHPASQHSLAEHVFLMKAISDHPLFSALDERAKALAVRKLFPLHVRAGAAIITQGDSGDYFYVIESGKCEIARRKPTCATPFVDRVIGRGASFGEAALLYNSRRGASVTALEDTKIWCMDRASFLTITRSGSAALLKLFQRVSSSKPSDSTETFVTQDDLRRMLKAPKRTRAQRQLERLRGLAMATPTAAAVDDPTDSATSTADALQLPVKSAYDRAMQLGFALLFHDASGVINFSQFAHFHITLGASNVEQLLPEAAFRILKALATDTRNSSSSGGGEFPDASQGSVWLADLCTAMQQWTHSSDAAQQHQTASPPSASAFARLLDLQPSAGGELAVTQDDLARAIAALSDLDDSSDDVLANSDDTELVAARRELRAFAAALKCDIDALRAIWHAAELRAGGVNDDPNRGKRQLTFDANLQSGWISAIRHNPTGGDWASLQPSLEDFAAESTRARGGAGAFTDDDVEDGDALGKRKFWAQLTSFSAAIAAGALARTACAPLERLKILIQLGPPQVAASANAASAGVAAPYRSLARGLVNMVKLSGARSLFSGNLTHCLWVIPSLPTKFLLCDVYRSQLSELLPAAATAPTSSSSNAADAASHSPSSPTTKRASKLRADAFNLLAGGLAGLTANCLFYPLDVVRGRLSAQQYYSATKQYAGIRDAIRTIYAREGMRAFYRGFAPASAGVFAYIGSNYAIYEFLRPSFIIYDTDSASGQLGHPSIPGQILCATTASLSAQVLSYPFDVVRRRMQLQGAWHAQLTFPTYASSWHCARATVREERGAGRKLRALYRGLLVNSVKALPTAVISFVSYEKIREMQARADAEYEA